MQKKTYTNIFLKNCLFMQKSFMISLKKTAYSKQLIYTKQLIRISFLKNNLFETTYYDLIF